MRAFVTQLAVVGLLLGSPAISSAEVILYDDESTFLDANPIVSTETFDGYQESPLFETAVITIDSVVYQALPNSQNGQSEWRTGVHFSAAGVASTPDDFGSNLISDNIISFGPGKYVNAIGFWLLSGANRPGLIWEIEAKETDGGVEVVEVSDWENEKRYYGFSSPVGIESITVRDYRGDNAGSNWSYDDVSRTQIVPEPSTLVLLSLGGLLLLVFGRRGRRSA